ncbi:MAG: hypothetical protein Q9200_005381, partial [Gallowayella weberi]
DWEHFTYEISGTKLALKGRIFIDKPLRPNSLHFAIDGGLAIAERQPSNARLSDHDNPFTYRVPGCYFETRSKVARMDGRPTMTWKMMKDLLSALEEVLEKQRNYFEASFVLVDDSEISWGHGQIAKMGPPGRVAES